MRAALIINPVSGNDEPNTAKVPAIQAWLRDARIEADIHFTSPERPAGLIAREALATGVKTILAGGGDGTVSEVARELVHQPATLGILPIGTFNNIARSVGVLSDLPHAASIIAAGHVRKIDVGLANDSRYFFEAAGAGLDAALFPLGEEIKSGRWSRIVEVLRRAWHYRPQLFTITLQGPSESKYTRTIHCRALFVVAANGPYYGGGFTVAADARMRDGQLTVSIYRRFSKWELFRHFRSISGGRRAYSPKIETFNAVSATIASRRPMPVHADGEPLGATPATFRAIPGALRVFAPEHPPTTSAPR